MDKAEIIEGLFAALNNPSSAGVEFTAADFASIKAAFDAVVFRETDLGAAFFLRPGLEPGTGWAVKRNFLHGKPREEDHEPR